MPSSYQLFWVGPVTHIQRVDGLGDVELVHGGQDDGRCGQEEEHHEEGEVDAQPLQPPAEALDREVLPAEETGSRGFRLQHRPPARAVPWQRWSGPIQAGQETCPGVWVEFMRASEGKACSVC